MKCTTAGATSKDTLRWTRSIAPDINTVHTLQRAVWMKSCQKQKMVPPFTTIVRPTTVYMYLLVYFIFLPPAALLTASRAGCYINKKNHHIIHIQILVLIRTGIQAVAHITRRTLLLLLLSFLSCSSASSSLFILLSHHHIQQEQGRIDGDTTADDININNIIIIIAIIIHHFIYIHYHS